MEKVNIIIKAKTKVLGEAIADALSSSGKINVISIDEGDVNKKDWELCQEKDAVVVYSNVEKRYETDLCEDAPWGTLRLNFPQFNEIEREVKRNFKEKDRYMATKLVISRAVSESIDDTVRTITMLPRKGHTLKLYDLLKG